MHTTDLTRAQHQLIVDQLLNDLHERRRHLYRLQAPACSGRACAPRRATCMPFASNCATRLAGSPDGHLPMIQRKDTT